MTPTFRWKCSFMGTVDYDVTDETGTYRAAIRHRADAYELSIANGDDVRREMVTGVGILRRCNGVGPSYSYAMPPGTVAAFNAWRLAVHLEHVAHMEAHPDRYGCIPADDPLRKPPMVARRGDYVSGAGWLPIGEPLTEAALSLACRA